MPEGEKLSFSSEIHLFSSPFPLYPSVVYYPWAYSHQWLVFKVKYQAMPRLLTQHVSEMWAAFWLSSAVDCVSQSFYTKSPGAPNCALETPDYILRSHKDRQMAKKHRVRCSTSLIMRQMQINTIMSYHCTPVRWPLLKANKKTEDNKCWQGWWWN